MLPEARGRSRSTRTSSPRPSPGTSASRCMQRKRFRSPWTTSGFAAGAARTLEDKATGEYMRGYTLDARREPVGVVGQIAPWNYLMMMAIWKIAPASLQPATRSCSSRRSRRRSPRRCSAITSPRSSRTAS